MRTGCASSSCRVTLCCALVPTSGGASDTASGSAVRYAGRAAVRLIVSLAEEAALLLVIAVICSSSGGVTAEAGQLPSYGFLGMLTA